MATSPHPQWAQEMSTTHRGPTAAGVLRLALLVVLIVIAWQWFGDTEGGAAQVDRKPGVSLCEEHRSQPGWEAVCQETARREGGPQPGPAGWPAVTPTASGSTGSGRR